LTRKAKRSSAADHDGTGLLGSVFGRRSAALPAVSRGSKGTSAPSSRRLPYALPPESSPGAITAGPDGNLWFTNLPTNKIGRITTSGTITEFPLPASSTPLGITAGPDSKLWFTNATSSKIGKITP
jgi:virginiamycin B lyase